MRRIKASLIDPVYKNRIVIVFRVARAFRSQEFTMAEVSELELLGAGSQKWKEICQNQLFMKGTSLWIFNFLIDVAGRKRRLLLDFEPITKNTDNHCHKPLLCIKSAPSVCVPIVCECISLSVPHTGNCFIECRRVKALTENNVQKKSIRGA